MDWTSFFLTCLAAYLLGSINFAIIISKRALNIDIRNYGSGNAGSTNAYRTIGGKLAVLVAVGDLIKGVLAVLLGYWLLGPVGKLVGGVFVVLGHIFPVFYGFKGGKGVATTIALMLVIDWRVFLVCLTVFFATTLITRYISLASILTAVCFPCAMAHFYQYDALYIALSSFIGLLIIFMHRSNIVRLMKGTESKFHFSKPESVCPPKEKK